MNFKKVREMLIRHKIEDRYYLVFESLNKDFLAATDTPTRMELAEEVYDLQNIYKHPCFSTVAPTPEEAKKYARLEEKE